MNCKFKLKQRVAALCMAAMICCSLFPAGVFAETPRADADGTFIMEQDKEAVTDDIHQTEASDPDPGEESTPKSSEAAATSQSADEDAPVETSTDYTFDGAVLYTDLPDMPTGSYMGSQGLPVATGETKIGIFAWPNDQLEESADSYLSADTLNSDDLTMTAPLLEGTDYAVVPILAQVEYPADGSSLDVVLPNEVTVLDFYGVTADEATRSRLVHSEYTETSAAVMGLYVQADADFSAKLVYTAPDGSTLTKALHVVIDRSRTMAAPFAETTDVAAYAERPTPAVTSGKITKVEKVNGTWLIWFNGEEAYCCTHGANGQPKGCPPYTYTNTSLVSADQCIPGDHYGNQYRIWGGLDQLSMELLPDTPVAFSAEDTERISLLDFCRTFYDDTQMWLIEKYPESTAAKIYLESAQALLDGAVAYAKPRGYYTYIYTPASSGWQTVALIGPEISEEETEEPKPVVQEYYASWEAPAQSASGTVDLTYGVTTDKIQLKTLEKVDGATIEIEPITKSGTIDGGSWSISPAGVQTVTTSGHTNDENYQNNGGAASASWSVHYTVSKTVDGRSGSVGPYTTKEAADAAANSERDSAVAAIQAEAQSAVNNAIASAQAQLASLQFRYDEVTIPYGFESYWGSNGSHQTITVPANSNNAYKMRNAEWSLQIKIKKTDSETGNQIAGDARYEIYQWDVVTGKYQPTGGYNTYSVQRQGDGTYAVINNAAYATNDTMRHTLYYTQRNEGRFILVETKAPAGYFGDWTDIAHPGTAGTPLGKRAYYVEITADNNNSVLWLGNGDYNADIATGDKGGTKLVTSGGVETTVTIYDSPKDASRSYTTDASGKAANEDGYTTTAADGIMKNDRTLGEISISKVDLDAQRYVSGDAAHGNAVLDGAVYDLYAAEDITHPDGVTGVVDYSKIVDSNGNPLWHTTIRDNSGQWISDYLPVLKKDNLVASAKIEDGWLTFSNLYLGKYYVVERSTGTVIPLREGALAVSVTYPTVDSRTKAATGQVAALAASNGQYTDWVYKNQFSTISKSKALDGTWTYDAYYLSYAPGYLCDEHNGSRTLWYAKGDVVAVVTTGDGSADTAVFAPFRTKATYDFLSVIHDGTIGEVSITLPLGSYHVEETKPPYGYVGTTDSYDVTFVWDNQLSDVVMAKNIIKNGDSEQHFDVVRASEASAELAEQQTLGFYNDREHARVGVYKINQETDKYLAGAVFNLYTRDDIYDVDGNKLFSAGDLICTSPETVADGYTYFNCDVPIRGEWYGQSDRLDASTNSGNYFIRELHAPLGYYLNDAEMDVTFTYDGEVLQVLDNTCANKPTEMWVSKRDLTNDEELSGATLIIKDTKENIVDTWVSTDTPHRVTGLHFDEEYTLTEKRPADGYAVADDIVFRLERKTDADGHELDEADVYYLKDKKKLWIIPWEEWELLDDATVIMKDDITRVQISKVDIATGKELPGAELVIKDKDGNMVAQWVSEDKPHYIEKLPAGDYTLTEITAPNGYQLAESIAFTVLPTGELQTVVMKDARIPEETPHEDTPSNTPQPTPGSTPAPSPAPASTPTATPTPMPVIPQTGDVFPFALLSAAVFGSIVGFGILAYKRRKSKMDESEH